MQLIIVLRITIVSNILKAKSFYIKLTLNYLQWNMWNYIWNQTLWILKNWCVPYPWYISNRWCNFPLCFWIPLRFYICCMCCVRQICTANEVKKTEWNEYLLLRLSNLPGSNARMSQSKMSPPIKLLHMVALNRLKRFLCVFRMINVSE